MGGLSRKPVSAGWLAFPLLMVAADVPAQRIARIENIGQLAARLDPQPNDRVVNCEAEPVSPVLSFGFRFEAGYVFRLPPNLYEGRGHSWVALTQVTPEEDGAEPVYLIAPGRFPPAARQTRARAEARGAFWLGEGRYGVKWVVVDDQGRVCRKQWHMEASLGRAERKIKMTLPRNTVAEPSWRGFEDPVGTVDGQVPARLTVLLDAAPRRVRRNSQANLNPSDQLQLMGALTELLEGIPSPVVRLVVFSLEQQKEVFLREEFHLREMGQVANALNGLMLGRVDSRVLQDRGGRVRLVSDLINREMRGTEHADLVVLLGPEERYDDKIPVETFDRVEDGGPRFFYVQCRPAPRIAAIQAFDLGRSSSSNSPQALFVSDPGDGNNSDLLRTAMKRVQGETFTVYTPGQFAKAVDRIRQDVVTR